MPSHNDAYLNDGNTYTDKFIDQHVNFTIYNATNRTVEPIKTDAMTTYKYSSEEIHKGLERAVNALLARKVKVIVGDCGFSSGIQEIVTNIIRKSKFVKSLQPPCLMSTLTMLPTMLKMIAKDQVVLVLTSNGASFEEMFEKLTDGTSKDQVKVLGLENVPGFGDEVRKGTSVNRTEAGPGIKKEIEIKMIELEIENKTLGGILCECSELPAYSNQIRKAFRVPVFDAMTCASLVADSVKYNAFDD